MIMVHCTDYGHTWPEDHWYVSFYWLVPVHSKLSCWTHSKLQSIFCRTNLSRKWLCLLQASSVYYTILYAKTWAQEWGMDHKRSRGEARTLHTGGLNKKKIFPRFVSFPLCSPNCIEEINFVSCTTGNVFVFFGSDFAAVLLKR